MIKNLKLHKGFTLVELLVVVAILAILGAAVAVVIDPVDKINAANDAKAINDIGALANASEAYATANQGSYPATINDLVLSGELKNEPKPPTTKYGTAYSFTTVPSPCVAGSTCTAVKIYISLKSKKYTANPRHLYDSATGKTCDIPITSTVCP